MWQVLDSRDNSTTYLISDAFDLRTIAGVCGSCGVGGAKQSGGYVTMQLFDGGNAMLFSMGGGDQNFPSCKVVVGGGYADYADYGA